MWLDETAWDGCALLSGYRLLWSGLVLVGRYSRWSLRQAMLSLVLAGWIAQAESASVVLGLGVAAPLGLAEVLRLSKLAAPLLLGAYPWWSRDRRWEAKILKNRL